MEIALILSITVGMPTMAILGFVIGRTIGSSYWQYRTESKKLESAERMAVLAARNQRENQLWSVTTTTVPTNDS